MEGVTQTVTRDFTYDGFYRLISSTAQMHNQSITYTVQTDVTRRYSVATTFDDIHNITSKNQTVTDVDPVTGLDAATPDYSKTYNFTQYTYAEGRPHVLDALSYSGGTRNYSFDQNGNNTGYAIPYLSVGRTWDEENRMKSMSYGTPGGGYTEVYKYNESGERVTKRKVESYQATTETNYVNQFMSVSRTDGDSRYVGTKNYYLGMERIASQVMPVGYSGVTSSVYVYHTDHLGSATYLTDLSGDIKEHIEYTPWGESWVENTGASFIPNYKFTGKEQDRTGLYYFGARYYDPQVSLWMSADPILGRYLDGKINDGIYKSMNFSLFSYSAQNPLIFIDADGNYYRSAATAYADAWAFCRNPLFSMREDDLNNDCANYVSQSLNAGGIASRVDWFNVPGEFKWNGNKEMKFYTQSWTTAKGLTDWLRSSPDILAGEFKMTPDTTKEEIQNAIDSGNIAVGDVVGWAKDDAGLDIHHVGIVTQVKDGVVYYNGHTMDRQTKAIDNNNLSLQDKAVVIFHIKEEAK